MLAYRSQSSIRTDTPFARRLKATPFLIVDDSPFIRRTVREILHTFSVRHISDASDGMQGLEEAVRHSPQVIILDWFMPHLSGAEFIKVLRTTPNSPARDADIVVITGIPTLKVVAEAQALGVAGIIRKPFAPRALFDRLAGPAMRLNQMAETPRPVPPKPEPEVQPLTKPWKISPHRFGDDVGQSTLGEDDPMRQFTLKPDVWAI